MDEIPLSARTELLRRSAPKGDSRLRRPSPSETIHVGPPAVGGPSPHSAAMAYSAPTGHPDAGREGRRPVLDRPPGSTWCSCVGPRGPRSVSLWAGQTLAIDRHEEMRGVPVRRRGARTGGAGRRPRVALRSSPWRAGTPSSAPAHPCSETDASVPRGSTRNRISESHRGGAHRGR